MHQVDPLDLGTLPTMEANGLLLHIGVFKTGTTALQSAFWSKRDRLLELNVLFRGPQSWRYISLMNLYKRTGRRADGETVRMWDQLEQSVHGHQGRAFVSSEGMCSANDEQAADLVKRLAAGRPTKVLITARSIGELLPSQWQQFLKRGQTTDWENWLHEVLAEPRDTSLPFWRRFTFPEQVQRWASVVGAENVILVTIDKADPGRAIRVAEHLVGVPVGTVTLDPTLRSNPSMSYTEAEFLRNVNMLLIKDGVEYPQYRNLVRRGAFADVNRVDDAKSNPIPTPQWAVDAACREGMDQAALLSGSPGWIVGDLTTLGRCAPGSADPLEIPAQISIASASQAVVGALTSRVDAPTSVGRSSGSSLQRAMDRLRRVVGSSS